MCGFFGIMNLDGSIVDQVYLRTMTEKMYTRGPDSNGFYFDANVGLGFRRLSIIDLSTGDQPLSNEDDTVWLVMNGEIYNFLELRDELIGKGHLFKTGSDAEVIVHLYEEYGAKFVEYLNGMFAFALYDKVNNKMILGRDRLGIKPLYYRKNDNQIIFGSDAKLVAGTGASNISESGFLSYLSFGYTNNDSIFSGVSKLKAGCTLVFDNTMFDINSYWKIDRVGWNNITIDDGQVMLSNLLEDSIRLQLRSDVPIGVFLSGGVDSSAIVALASKVSKLPLNTYSIEYAGKNGKDPVFALEVSKQYETNHTTIVIGPEEVESYLDELLDVLDEPIADSAIIATYALSKRANQDGIKVILSGAGGDEIFGGYGRHRKPKILSRHWIRDLILFSSHDSFSKLLKKTNPGLSNRFGNHCLNYAAQISGVDYSCIERLLGDDRRYQKLTDLVNNEYDSIQATEAGFGYEYARMHNDLNGYLINNVLSLTDKATMAASVEARVPLLDHRLVEYAFSLRSHINMLNGEAKGLFKKTQEGALSSSVLYRKKEGFNAPVKQWVTGHAGLKVKNNLLYESSEPLKRFVDMNKLEQMLRKGSFDKRGFETIFSLYVFNRWCNRNVS